MQGYILSQKEVFSKYLEGRFGLEEDELWGELRKETQQAVKHLLESTMEIQVQDLLGSNRWEHSSTRKGYRNGNYYRNLLTSYGPLANLKMPRIRAGSVDFRFIKKYERRSTEVDKHILEMFLAGVSTRRVEEVLEPLYGAKKVSAGLVSKITKTLNNQVDKFHWRRLKDKYEYLILDAIYINAKSPVYKKRRCILVALGIWMEGSIIRRELIDFQMAPMGESESAWSKFLNGLFQRGLEGKQLELIATDGNSGLRNVISTVYPGASHQRCWAHKMRNVSDKLPRKYQNECMADASKIYKAGNYSAAVREYKIWSEKWRLDAYNAVKCMDEDIEELLNFYEAPEKIWKKIRTTNGIERVFREVRRRTRTMSCFQNTKSVERITYAILYRMNKKWGNIDFEYIEDSLNEITQLC